ncbi:MAG: hypothetical protein M0Z85_04255 [Gammaproteobacteria bacterium]|nr:hypothetical protein [Gammaproteobacteria bacterium]
MTQDDARVIEVDEKHVPDVRNLWMEYVRNREKTPPGNSVILGRIRSYLPESAGTPSKNGCIYTKRLSLVPDDFLELLMEKGIPYQVCS